MINSQWKKLLVEEKAYKESVMRDHEFSDAVLSEHTPDIVNEPEHYARWEIEPIEFIMRNNFEMWRGNCTKYIARAGFKLYEGKSQVESEIIDIKKNIRYSQMRINQLEGKDKL